MTGRLVRIGLVALVVAGCGGEEGAGGGDGAGGAGEGRLSTTATEEDVCALVDLEVVESAFGGPADLVGRGLDNRCEVRVASPEGRVSLIVTRGNSPRLLPIGQPRRGIGDGEAYYAPEESIVRFAAGGASFQLTIFGEAPDLPGDPLIAVAEAMAAAAG